jgi:hypothetical protein
MSIHHHYHHDAGFQCVAIEGTAAACSVLYEHEEEARKNSFKTYQFQKSEKDRLSPNITRTQTTLHSDENSNHLFYHSFVEMTVSMESPLYGYGYGHGLSNTEPAASNGSEQSRQENCDLVSLGMASPHYRFVKLDNSGVAGATPLEIATHRFAMVPMWSTEKKSIDILMTAHKV